MKRNHSISDARSTRRGAAFASGHPPSWEDFDTLATLDALERDAVELGATVHICDLRTGEREEYTLVPPDDADILRHRISTFSPIGRALFGRRVGEIVEVDAPAGTIAIQIEHVRRSL